MQQALGKAGGDGRGLGGGGAPTLEMLHREGATAETEGIDREKSLGNGRKKDVERTKFLLAFATFTPKDT